MLPLQAVGTLNPHPSVEMWDMNQGQVIEWLWSLLPLLQTGPSMLLSWRKWQVVLWREKRPLCAADGLLMFLKILVLLDALTDLGVFPTQLSGATVHPSLGDINVKE